MFKTNFGDGGNGERANGTAEARSAIDGVVLEVCGTMGLLVRDQDDWSDGTYESVPIGLTMTIRAHEARRIAAILISAADEADRISDRSMGRR